MDHTAQIPTEHQIQRVLSFILMINKVPREVRHEESGKRK